MPICFLDLPREIRDVIYAYVFATTGLIEVVATRYSKKDPFRTSGSNARLVLKQKILNAKNEVVQVVDAGRDLTLSLSLMSTCRQVNQETKSTFWTRNMFYFPSLEAPKGSSTTIMDPRKLFKFMGQDVSRLVSSIALNIPSDSGSMSHLPRILGYLASRSRWGDFKKLELVCTVAAFIELGRNALLLHELRRMLAKDRSPCRYERIIRIPEVEDRSFRNWDTLRTSKAIHEAFGGKLYWGDVLLWDNHVRRGEPALLSDEFDSSF